MAFKVCVFYSFIPTKHSTWQNQKTLSVPSSTFSSFLSPSLPSKPSSQTLKSVDPLNKSQQASAQHFPSEEFHLPCLLSWRGGFLSHCRFHIASSFCEAEVPIPFKQCCCHLLSLSDKLGDLSKCIPAAPSLKPRVFMQTSVDLLPMN